MKNKIFFFVLLLYVMTSCSKEYSATGSKPIIKEDSFNLRIQFKPVIDSVKLSIDSIYTNYWKEKYTVSAFKFYVSQFDLINTDSNRAYHLNTDKYFLIDALDSTTWTVKLLSVPFTYNRISFLIGIDSIGHAKGTKAKGLDSTKGMYWTKKEGYIMAKLEGSSVSDNKKFQYHIGGFKGPENVLRKPTLLFPVDAFSIIAPNKKSTIHINANVNAWFNNPHELKIEENSFCTMPSLLSKNISENYSKMFVVTTVVNE